MSIRPYPIVFKMYCSPVGKTSKSKENKTSLRNAADRLRASIHASSMFNCGSTGIQTWDDCHRKEYKALTGSEKLSQ